MLVNLFSYNSSSLEDIIIIIMIMLIVFVFSLTLHEFAHAFAAYKMGDQTPKAAGRLTLNPLKHLDSFGMLMFLFLGIGWAKPVPTNPVKFKKYRVGIRWVSIAGILANVLLGLLGAGTYAVLKSTVGTPNQAMAYVYFALNYLMLINSYLALFNLLPVYPLDGFNFVTSFMKSNNKFIYYSLKNGFKIVIGILLTCAVFRLMFNYDLMGAYLSLINDFIFVPIKNLGV